MGQTELAKHPETARNGLSHTADIAAGGRTAPINIEFSLSPSHITTLHAIPP